MKKRLIAIVLAMVSGGMAPGAIAQTLETTRTNGFVRCGVTEGVAGFSFLDERGIWSGIEVDFCRAMAAAIFDDADAVRFTPLSTQIRFDSLASGNVDILARATTWTMLRDVSLDVAFVGSMFYDGQSFMVPASAGIESALSLSGASICIEGGTTGELNVADYFSGNGLDAAGFMVFPSRDEAIQAYLDGSCTALTADASALAAERSGFIEPDAHIVLPEVVSKEPLGPVVRDDDADWLNIARWVLFALINAEELGVTAGNVEEMRGSDDPDIQRLLGVGTDLGTPIGLTSDWAYRVIAQVGNYGEIYERHVGEDTLIGIPRGINNLWTRGGILYAPPIR